MEHIEYQYHTNKYAVIAIFFFARKIIMVSQNLAELMILYPYPSSQEGVYFMIAALMSSFQSVPIDEKVNKKS